MFTVSYGTTNWFAINESRASSLRRIALLTGAHLEHENGLYRLTNVPLLHDEDINELCSALLPGTVAILRYAEISDGNVYAVAVAYTCDGEVSMTLDEIHDRAQRRFPTTSFAHQ